MDTINVMLCSSRVIEENYVGWFSMDLPVALQQTKP